MKGTHVGALDEEQIGNQSNVADDLTAQPQSAERGEGGKHPVWDLLNDLAHCRGIAQSTNNLGVVQERRGGDPNI